jgi:hypothetical protein
VDWSYVAGFVDGEGSLCIHRGGTYVYKGVPRWPTYRPLIAVSNNHRGVLEQMRDFIGFGSIHNHPRSSPNAKLGYALHLSGFRIAPVLEKLQPLLIIKKRQAEVMLAFIERRRRQKTRPFTSEDYAHVEEMRRLNDRAPGKGSPIMPIPDPRLRQPWGSIGVKEIGSGRWLGQYWHYQDRLR